MEYFDEALKGVMGDRYDDGEEPVEQEKPRPKAVEPPKGAEKVSDAMDADYVSVPKYAPNVFTRLRGCTKWAMIFGGLVCLFFYWQEAGLMAPEAAVPCMCVCTGLGSFKIGEIWRVK